MIVYNRDYKTYDRL